MKCPRCNFVTSNKKDLCPRCEFDLRAKKRELGLVVTAPLATSEQLLAEHRSTQVVQKKSELEPRAAAAAAPTPDKKQPFWKKLLPTSAQSSPPPAPRESVHQAAQPKAPAAEKPMPEFKAPPPVPAVPANANQPDPLSFKLAAPLSAPKPEPAPFIDDDGLDFPFAAFEIPTPAPPSAAATPPAATITAAKTAAPSVAAAGSMQIAAATPAAAPEMDLQELISALDQLSAERTKDSEEALFSKPVGGIDESLDEIIHALDELEPQEDLDEIELFQTKLSDLAESLSENVDEAQLATEDLAEHDFNAAKEAESDEPEDSEEQEEKAAAAAPEAKPETQKPDYTFTTRGQVPFESSTPAEPPAPVSPMVSPQVLEFNDSDAGFEQTLDDIIGDTILDIEAVIEQKPKSSASSDSSYMSEDGMEISFEVELEGAEVEVEQPVEEKHDEILSGLLDTYETLHAGTERKMIAPEREDFQAAEESAAPAQSDPGSPHLVFRDVVVPEEKPESAALDSRVESLLGRLSFLSEELLGEIKDLVHSAAARSARTPYLEQALPDPQHAPVDEMQQLEDQLGSELELLKGEGMSIFSEQSEERGLPSDEFLLSDDELRSIESDLEAEFAEEESETPSALHPTVDEFEVAEPQELSPITGPVPAKAEEQAGDAESLENLQAQLDQELNALGSEGMTLFTAEEAAAPEVSQEAPVAPPQFEDLSALEAELGDEVAALEQEGMTVFSPQEEQQPESIQAEPIVAQQPAEAPAAKEFQQHSQDLSALEAELGSELAALEHEGLSVYAAETIETPSTEQALEPAVQPQPEVSTDVTAPAEQPIHEQFDLSALESELGEELAALEMEGLSVYHGEQSAAEKAADTSEAVPPQESVPEEIVEYQPKAEDIAALESELGEELAALELEGLSVYREEEQSKDQASEEQAAAVDTNVEVEPAPYEPSAEDLAALESQLGDELAALELEGLSVYHEGQSSVSAPEISPQHEALMQDTFPEVLPALELEAPAPVADAAEAESFKKCLGCTGCDTAQAIQARENVIAEPELLIDVDPEILEASAEADTIEMAAQDEQAQPIERETLPLVEQDLDGELSAHEAEAPVAEPLETTAPPPLAQNHFDSGVSVDDLGQVQIDLEAQIAELDAENFIVAIDDENRVELNAPTALDTMILTREEIARALSAQPTGEPLETLPIAEERQIVARTPVVPEAEELPEAPKEEKHEPVELSAESAPTEEIPVQLEAAVAPLVETAELPVEVPAPTEPVLEAAHSPEPAEEIKVPASSEDLEPAAIALEEPETLTAAIDELRESVEEPIAQEAAPVETQEVSAPEPLMEEPKPVIEKIIEQNGAEHAVPNARVDEDGLEDVLNAFDETIEDETSEPSVAEPLPGSTGSFLVKDLANFAEPLPGSTGSFLVKDLANIAGLAAEEKFETLSAPDEKEEIALSELSALFGFTEVEGKSADEPAPSREPLDSAVNTGTFLAADLQKIIAAAPPAQSIAPVHIAPELWAAAEQQLAQTESPAEKEVEFFLSDFSKLQRTGAIDVLFDVVEEELQDPEKQRHRITEIPKSAPKVENESLKQALNAFEKEERILSKRRSKFRSAVEIAGEEKPVVLIAAAPWRRAAAVVIDAAVVILVSVLFAYVSFLPEEVTRNLFNPSQLKWSETLPCIAEFLGLNLLLWITFTALLISGWGQTFGGYFLKIEVVTLKGITPGLNHALLRALSQVSSLLTLGLGFLPALCRKNALHDRMSLTAVRAVVE